MNGWMDEALVLEEFRNVAEVCFAANCSVLFALLKL